MPRKPTKKQKDTFNYLVMHPDASIAEAMKQAGYTPTTADKPGQNFIGLEGVKTLAEDFQIRLQGRITNFTLVEKVAGLMEAKKLHASMTEPDRWVPDNGTQVKALEIALKLRGLANDTNVNQTNVQVNVGDLKSQYSKEGE